MEDRNGVNDKDDRFTVLTEWGSQKFFDVQGHAWAFTGLLTVLPRKTSDSDLLQKTREALGAVAERQSNGIRYLCAHLNISVFMQTDDAKDTKLPGQSFSPNHKVLHEQVGGVAAEPMEMAPYSRQIGRQQRV